MDVRSTCMGARHGKRSLQGNYDMCLTVASPARLEVIQIGLPSMY